MKISSHNVFETPELGDIQPVDAVVIIGNGFDLSLGLKTSYTDFIKDNTFLSLIDEKNEFAEHLQKKSKLQNWIDIELELSKYSTRFSEHETRNFYNDFIEVKNQLSLYLSKIEFTKINKDSSAFKFLSTLSGYKCLIADFNYTNTYEYIRSNFKEIDLSNNKHIKIHGSISNDNIIFGVDDRTNIRQNHIFLKKSVNDNYNTINFNDYFIQCNSVGIFGHSLGLTDHMYFKDYFKKAISQSNKQSNKDVSIFYYNEGSRLNIHSELDILTNKSISKFKTLNNVKFINCS